MRFFLVFIIFFCIILRGQDFLYPVASVNIDGKPKIYVIYQKSIGHLELWLWDPETKVATKGLLSTNIPAALKVLPSGNAFSFIDDGGRIRVKYFSKRSAKSIDFCDPVYDISQIHWIDDDNFYLSAKKNNKFCIFHVNQEGLIKPILQDFELKTDYMYPQKVGDSIFYIERVGKKAPGYDKFLNNQEKNNQESNQHSKQDNLILEQNSKQDNLSLEQNLYRISRTVYPDLVKQFFDLNNFLKCTDDFDLKAKKVQEFHDNCNFQKEAQENGQCLVDLKTQPIAFLSMITDSFGFFISHPETICKHDKIIDFDCFIITSLVNKDSLEQVITSKNLLEKDCLISKSVAASQQEWEYIKIFSFSIPTDLIINNSDSCLYESILPLLPKYFNNKIYYANYIAPDSGLNIFCYDLVNKKVTKVFESGPEVFLFSPVFLDCKLNEKFEDQFCDQLDGKLENKVFFGGTIDYTESCPVNMWINESGQVCIDLPAL